MSRKLTDDERKAKGTFRPDRKDTAPTLTAGRPKPTRDLSEAEQAEWDKIVGVLEQMGTLTPVDAFAIEQVSRARVQLAKLEEWVEANGETYTSETEGGGMIERPHPQVAMLESTWRRVQAGLRDLGLTPATRTRVRTAPKADTGEPKSKIQSLLERRERRAG